MRLRLPTTLAHMTTPFIEVGMESVDVVEIAAKLECRPGRRISSTRIYNYPNVAALARWLSNPLPEAKRRPRRGRLLWPSRVPTRTACSTTSGR